MFERLKKVFGKDDKAAFPPSSQMASNQVSEWAGTQGFSYSAHVNGQSFSLDGKVGGKPWRIERGRPTRNFIRGEELRARAELGVDEDVTVLVMNRPLKEALEKKAYSIYTDGLQTTADPHLPEEMRWLAMYEEFGWDSQPAEFWDRFCVLSGSREHALAFVDAPLAERMLNWPQPGPSRETPFMLMVLRGKAYLRMEYNPADMPTLQHAADIFNSACESAMGGLMPPKKA